jgi:hypothetical protein
MTSLTARTISLGLLALGLVAIVGSFQWIGRPFPGFFLLPNRVVPSVGLPDWSGRVDGRAPYQDVLLTIDGQALDARGGAVRILAAHAPDEPVRYELVHNGALDTRTFPLRRFDWTTHGLIFGAYLLSGLAYLLLAATAAERWTEHPLFPALASFGWVTALYAFTGIDIYNGPEMFRLQAIAEALLPAVALHLALVFPTDRLEGRRDLLGIVYGLAGALGLIYQLFLYDPAVYSVVHNLCQALVALPLIAFAIGLGMAVPAPPAGLGRESLQYCFVGTLVGFVMPALVLGISGATGGLVPVNVTGWFTSAFPLVWLAYGPRSLAAAAARDALGEDHATSSAVESPRPR